MYIICIFYFRVEVVGGLHYCALQAMPFQGFARILPLDLQHYIENRYTLITVLNLFVLKYLAWATAHLCF